MNTEHFDDSQPRVEPGSPRVCDLAPPTLPPLTGQINTVSVEQSDKRGVRLGVETPIQFVAGTLTEFNKESAAVQVGDMVFVVLCDKHTKIPRPLIKGGQVQVGYQHELLLLEGEGKKHVLVHGCAIALESEGMW